MTGGARRRAATDTRSPPASAAAVAPPRPAAPGRSRSGEPSVQRVHAGQRGVLLVGREEGAHLLHLGAPAEARQAAHELHVGEVAGRATGRRAPGRGRRATPPSRRRCSGSRGGAASSARGPRDRHGPSSTSRAARIVARARFPASPQASQLGRRAAGQALWRGRGAQRAAGARAPEPPHAGDAGCSRRAPTRSAAPRSPRRAPRTARGGAAAAARAWRGSPARRADRGGSAGGTRTSRGRCRARSACARSPRARRRANGPQRAS